MRGVFQDLKNSFHTWRILLGQKAYVISLAAGLVGIFVADFLNYLMSVYNDQFEHRSVGDLILDRIPTYDLEFLFVWGMYFVIVVCVIFTVVYKPQRAPFILKTFALLFVVRCGFIGLTHIGPPSGFFYDSLQDQIRDPLQRLIFRNDLFFSGHTAFPFLAFLLFKGSWFRWVMLFFSFLMGITVLLMHVHYSIDVFAAFFITHGVYYLSEKIFHGLNITFDDRLKNVKF